MALLSPKELPSASGSAANGSDGNALLAMLQGGPSQGTSAEAATAQMSNRPVAAPVGVAASATPGKAAKVPKGVTLARGDAVYEVGAVGASARKQTKVTAITIYNTDPGYRAGRLIAVSSRYICYGVRGGSIRVIHQTTGQRLLQKGHTTSELADLSISGEGDSCILAAVAGNGDLFVWEISIENMTEVKATELFRRDGGNHAFSRILWHPTLPHLATATGGNTPKVCIWKDFAEKANPTCQEMAAGHSDLITGLAWVPGSAEGIASAGADGKVVVCSSSGEVQASFVPFGGEPVQAVLVAQPKGASAPLIVTGSANNSCIKMWDSTGTKCLHSVTFGNPGGEGARAAPEVFRATVDLDPYNDFVLVMLGDVACMRVCAWSRAGLAGAAGWVHVIEHACCCVCNNKMCVYANAVVYATTRCVCMQMLSTRCVCMQMMLCMQQQDVCVCNNNKDASDKDKKGVTPPKTKWATTV